MRHRDPRGLRPGPAFALLCAALAGAASTADEAPAPAGAKVASESATGTVAPESATGTIAPEFTADRLDGGTMSLASLRGRVVLLNFWGIACPPCRIEMPELERIQRRHAARGLVVLGVAEMNPTREETRRFIAGTGTTYPILLDPGERLGGLYGLEAHPTTFVIDARGVITFVNEGYLRGEEKRIEAAIVVALDALDARGTVRP